MSLSEYIGEATAYDKKLMLERKDPTSWLKSMSAFANTRGGKLLYGVSDDGELVGLENAGKDAEDISEIVKTQMDPIPQMNLSIHEEGGKRFVVVEVFAGEETPYYVRHKGSLTAYVRIGNESVRADPLELNRLVLKGSRRSWDSLPSVYSRRDYSFEVLYSLYHEKTLHSFEETDFRSFIHRDYLVIGSEVHVDIFDDRLEIYSPGGMPSGEFVQSLDMRSIPSERRNPVVADLFQRLRLMERRGSGFKKIMGAYQAESQKRGVSFAPEFRSTAKSFFVVLPNLNHGTKFNAKNQKTTKKTTIETTTETTIETTVETVASGLGKNAALTYRLIVANNRITAAEIAQRLGLSVDGARYQLKKLKSANLVKFIGNPKGGHWEVGGNV